MLNEKKRFGKIVCFRDLKANVDAAIKLFSNNTPNEKIIRPPFEKVRKELNLKMISFLEKYPDVSRIDALKSEPEKREFVLAFREIIRGKIEAQIYEEYEADDPYFIMSEQEYMDFRSKYLDIAIGHTGDKQKGTPDATQTEIEHENIDNVDFCLELLHSDVINVAYILALIADLNPDSEDYRQKRQQIIDTMIRDASMRNKAKLIDGFIQQNVDDDKAGFNRRKGGRVHRLGDAVDELRQRSPRTGDRTSGRGGGPESRCVERVSGAIRLPSTRETRNHSERYQREEGRAEGASQYPQTGIG